MNTTRTDFDEGFSPLEARWFQSVPQSEVATIPADLIAQLREVISTSFDPERLRELLGANVFLSRIMTSVRMAVASSGFALPGMALAGTGAYNAPGTGFSSGASTIVGTPENMNYWAWSISQQVVNTIIKLGTDILPDDIKSTAALEIIVVAIGIAISTASVIGIETVAHGGHSEYYGYAIANGVIHFVNHLLSKTKFGNLGSVASDTVLSQGLVPLIGGQF